jgi:hypothetical protein
VCVRVGRQLVAFEVWREAARGIFHMRQPAETPPPAPVNATMMAAQTRQRLTTNGKNKPPLSYCREGRQHFARPQAQRGGSSMYMHETIPPAPPSPEVTLRW